MASKIHSRLLSTLHHREFHGSDLRHSLGWAYDLSRSLAWDYDLRHSKDWAYGVLATLLFLNR